MKSILAYKKKYTYSYQPHKNQPYEDIRHTVHQSIPAAKASCEISCNDDPDCVGYVVHGVHPNKAGCWTKSKIDSPISVDPAMKSILAHKKAPYPSNVGSGEAAQIFESLKTPFSPPATGGIAGQEGSSGSSFGMDKKKMVILLVVCLLVLGSSSMAVLMMR
jgi:hypothetical protein